MKQLLSASLILLYVYAACSKLLDFATFRGQLYNQSFPHGLADILLYALPAAELLVAGLLCLQRTRRAGLWLSLGLLLVFTGYILLVKLHFWAQVPCSCGGILGHLSWWNHFFFNLLFTGFNVAAIANDPKGEPKTFEKSRH